ncbi:hypothetical protein [Rhodococcoides kyotonense]|uniref:DUF732 domain-containing protein n=1 Tax=Rhodococcoides kyotonense TaxID=398843 RepID=A0A239FKU9_9NOCA|nr:hypothetical protein [Rhodococcus kyotonensis]SNS57401.1 hypothetical protein SAMN05421642_103343 [Rhodococcus kyotonensis]
MKRGLTAIAAIALLATAGCSTETSGTASAPRTSQTGTSSASSTTTELTEDSTVSGYHDTCQTVTDLYDTLDQLGGEPTDRRAAVDQMIEEMVSDPEWDDTPESEQREILRGMNAAASGYC